MPGSSKETLKRDMMFWLPSDNPKIEIKNEVNFWISQGNQNIVPLVKVSLEGPGIRFGPLCVKFKFKSDPIFGQLFLS